MGYKSTQPKPNFSLSDPLPDDTPDDTPLNASGNKRGMYAKNKKVDAEGNLVARKYMMPAETIRMGVLLQTHLKPVLEDERQPNGERLPTKYFRYAKGWDDEKIAKETGDRLDAGHVARLRRSLEMKLEPVEKVSKFIGSHIYKARFNAIDKRLDDVVAQFDVVTEQVTSLSNRMQELALKNKALESTNEAMFKTVHDLTHRVVQLQLAASVTPTPATNETTEDPSGEAAT